MKTILLAEDNPDDVWIMKRAVKAAGLSNPMHLVENGRDAVAYLAGEGPFADRSLYPLPSLVLLDVKMPYLNGLEVLKWIRTSSLVPTILTVFLTSSSDMRDIDEAYRLGANAYLVKPSELSKLSEMIKAMEQFLLTHNRLPSLIPPP